MSARDKLNRAYLNGALLVAGVFGVIGQSWSIFVMAAVLLSLLSVATGEVRLSRRKRR